MQLAVVESIHDIQPEDWNALTGTGNPFLRHAFLAALETHGAVGRDSGWHPQYLTVTDHQRLLGAVPLFLKDHSFGEFVFDWSWAEAYARAGLDYYPKLIAAVPYTPVTGHRLLIHRQTDRAKVVAALVEGALEHAGQLQLSSLHWLFVTEPEQLALADHGLLLRRGCQFHWFNDGYRDFDDFLNSLSSRKRKKIRHERHCVREQSLEIVVHRGKDIDESLWRRFHRFYKSTFDRKMNFAPLSTGFFIELGQSMPESTILILAYQNNHPVAGAFFLRNDDTLYGRHWGCERYFDKLHFELCYYRAIEYCIDNKLQCFEAGAQGEHKLTRGFRPVITTSAHWLAHAEFRSIIREFLARESRAVTHYAEEMNHHLPYRQMT